MSNSSERRSAALAEERLGLARVLVALSWVREDDVGRDSHALATRRVDGQTQRVVFTFHDGKKFGMDVEDLLGVWCSHKA